MFGKWLYRIFSNLLSALGARQFQNEDYNRLHNLIRWKNVVWFFEEFLKTDQDEPMELKRNLQILLQ